MGISFPLLALSFCGLTACPGFETEFGVSGSCVGGFVSLSLFLVSLGCGICQPCPLGLCLFHKPRQLNPKRALGALPAPGCRRCLGFRV